MYCLDRLFAVLCTSHFKLLSCRYNQTISQTWNLWLSWLFFFLGSLEKRLKFLLTAAHLWEEHHAPVSLSYSDSCLDVACNTFRLVPVTLLGKQHRFSSCHFFLSFLRLLIPHTPYYVPSNLLIISIDI